MNVQLHATVIRHVEVRALLDGSVGPGLGVVHQGPHAPEPVGRSPQRAQLGLVDGHQPVGRQLALDCLAPLVAQPLAQHLTRVVLPGIARHLAPSESDRAILRSVAPDPARTYRPNRRHAAPTGYFPAAVVVEAAGAVVVEPAGAVVVAPGTAVVVVAAGGGGLGDTFRILTMKVSGSLGPIDDWPWAP